MYYIWLVVLVVAVIVSLKVAAHFWTILVIALGIGLVVMVVRFLFSSQHERRVALVLIRRNQAVWATAGILGVVTSELLYLASKAGLVIPVIHIGLPGTPWLFWSCVVIQLWLVIAITVAAAVDRNIRNRVAIYIGDFIRSKGFWGIFGEENAPANRLFCIWIWLGVMTVLYGVPSVDLVEHAYSAQQAGNELLASNPLQGIGVLELVKSEAAALFGADLAVTVPTSISIIEPPQPSYHKGWFLITVWFITTVFMIIGIVCTRRDGFREAFRSVKARMSGEATSARVATEAHEGEVEDKGEGGEKSVKDTVKEKATETVVQKGTEKLFGVTGFVASDLLAYFLGRGIETSPGWLKQKWNNLKKGLS